MEIIFISSNPGKRRAVEDSLCCDAVSVRLLDWKLEEIQSPDMAKIAEDKVVKAFERVWRPVLVEQTGLLLPDFLGLPGGFTQTFWDTLGPGRFSRLFAPLEDRPAIAKSVFAFCDGQRIEIFQGETPGRIVNPPRGGHNFDWGSVFEPEGETRTFGQMTAGERECYSMQKTALKAVRAYLEASL